MGKKRHAHAHADRHERATFDLERRLDRGVNAPKDALQLRQRITGRQVPDHQHELVTPEPGDVVGAAQEVAHPLGELDEHQVTGEVPVVVVDELEAVEVDHTNGDGAAILGGLRELDAHVAPHRLAVGKTGELVVARVVRELLALLDHVGHVAE